MSIAKHLKEHAALGVAPAIFNGVTMQPSPRTSAGIIAAQAAIALMGSGVGTVSYEDAEYTIDQDITLLNNISHIGVRPKLLLPGNVPDAGFSVVGGTRFLVSPGVTAFKHNNVDYGAITNPLAETGLQGVEVRFIAFIGGKGHIDTGSYLGLGALYSRFSDLYSFDSTDFGFNFENFQHCSIGNLYESTTQASGGGIRFACSMNATLLPGNSTIYGEIYTYTPSKSTRSIAIESVGPAGCQMNEVFFNCRMQANRYGSASTLAISGAFTNGSANIVVANQAQYDACQIGLPVVFTGTTPANFTQHVTYWVASRVDGSKTITLAANPVSLTGVSAGSTLSYTMTTGGFPGLEIHANSTSTFTNCEFGSWDLECYYNLTSVSMRRVRTSIGYLSEAFPSQNRNSIVARDCAINIDAGNLSGLTCDYDSSSVVLINYEQAGNRNLSAGETLANTRHQCVLHVNSATPVTITVPTLLIGGFECDIIQAGAGQVTIAGSGTTISNRSSFTKTAGQYARISIKQSPVTNTVYILSGDGAV